MNSMRDYLSPLARAMLAAVFIVSGIAKVFEYQATEAYMVTQGVPPLLLPVVIATEIIGGVMVAVGWHARIAAAILAAFSFLAGVVFHLVPGIEAGGAEQVGQMAHFWKNLAIAGGMVMIVANGPGILSMERAAEDAKRRTDPEPT